MNSYRTNPDSPENEQASKQHAREVFALKMRYLEESGPELDELWESENPDMPLIAREQELERWKDE